MSDSRVTREYKLHGLSELIVWSYYVQMMGYWEIIVTKPYLVSKEAQLYSLSNGEKSSSILFGETFLLAN